MATSFCASNGAFSTPISEFETMKCVVFINDEEVEEEEEKETGDNTEDEDADVS